jgi:hypothetical protein
MKTMWQFHGKMITCIVFLLVSLVLYSRSTSAQYTGETSICTYQETRQNVPINPKTNKPYTPEERNQEPFTGASISKEHIKQCLQAKQPLKNHHIVFENYRDSWKELTKETGNYDIPLLIDGGILYAQTIYNKYEYVGRIDLLEFRDPMSRDASKLTESERNTLETAKKDDLIALIRSPIEWKNVSIDSIVSVQGRIPIIFRNGANFSSTIFNNKADFYNVRFVNGANFASTIFNNSTIFKKTTFNKEAIFDNTTFNGRILFDNTIMNNKIDFIKATFNNEAAFIDTTFNGTAYFMHTTFNNNIFFISNIFKYIAAFNNTIFHTRASFISSVFKHDASFYNALFKGNTGFNNIRAEEKLTFDKATWEGRVDLRGISAKELRWASTEIPSEVKGVFDLREATIGRATFNEVRFQDVVDFSRVTFGAYKVGVPLPRSWNLRPSLSSTYIEKVGPLSAKSMPMQTLWTISRHPSPLTRFANNTFEKEADFLHITFKGSALLINNRFRSTLDLTGATFEAHNTETSPIQDTQPRLCLSYNHISRLVLGLEHLGNPPSVSPYDLLITKPLGSLLTNPLQTSRVRQVVGTADALQCELANTNTSNTKIAIANRRLEKLDDIYKTIGQSFREANNQAGFNEAWYLQKVVEQNQQHPVWCWLSRVFLDIPSRYTVDVWRTVWVSIIIMLFFFACYVGVLRRLVRSDDPDAHQLQVPAYPARQRAFRIRLFEPIHIYRKTAVGQEAIQKCVGIFPCQRNHRVMKMPGYQASLRAGRYRTNVQDPVQGTRRIIPWRDAAAISFRAFTKIGLGASYPNTRGLKVLTSIEWVLGVYMLIHFSLAVKNNLPFIAPFLGVVN